MLDVDEVVRPKEAKRDDSNELTRCNNCVESSPSNGRKRRDRRDGGAQREIQKKELTVAVVDQVGSRTFWEEQPFTSSSASIACEYIFT